MDPGEYLWGVSCTTGLCVAVDGYGNVLTSTEPAQGISSWASARVDDSGHVGLRNISCASIALCLVTDQYGDVLNSTDPMGSRPAWTIEDGGLLSSYGVSCASRTFCATTNIGNQVYWVSTSGEPAGRHTWIEQSAWSYPGIIIGRSFGPSGSVSCPSSSLCVADMDSFNDFNTLATSTDPAGGHGQWHTVEPGQFIGSGNEVSPPYYADPVLGVSCASQALCVAVDAAGNVLASTNPASNESTWTISPADVHLLDGISCPSASFCVAVDDAGDVVTSSDPAASTPTWTVSDVDGGNAIAGVSCTSESLCVAVDAAGNALPSTDPAGGAGAWSAVRWTRVTLSRACRACPKGCVWPSTILAMQSRARSRRRLAAVVDPGVADRLMGPPPPLPRPQPLRWDRRHHHRQPLFPACSAFWASRLDAMVRSNSRSRLPPPGQSTPERLRRSARRQPDRANAGPGALARSLMGRVRPLRLGRRAP